MSASHDTTPSTPKRILMVVSNPATSTTVGGPVGFWASELTHPYLAFREVGYEVTIASPDGGRVAFDALSDPRDESGYSRDDLISMGFIHTDALMARLDDTPSLSELDETDFDAIVVCGGQGPMFTFRKAERLHELLAAFYEAEKPTAALCHGVCALLDVRLSDGSLLIEGTTITGFANSEEDIADEMVGQPVMPFRIEDEARQRGAHYVTNGPFKPFAIRDGRLITGQQQYSGTETAHLVIEALGI
ncbi:MAG: type 1 glutamine amidotransferase domain-containing protein [Bacteroidetes bacterium]|nr:type 1 glutamine amidotransferase domain-containing protein [Bacteroidota bacterium]